MEDLLLNSPKIPFTNRVMVDEDKLLDALDDIRNALPAEFKQAKEVIASRDAIVAESERQAEAIRAAAENDRLRLINETEIFRAAQGEADRLVRDAHITLHEQQVNADAYAEKVLSELEGKIGRTLGAIQHNRAQLAQATGGGGR